MPYKDPEKTKEYDWKRSKTPKFKEYQRNWRESNPDKLRKIYAKHYAKRRDLDYVELNDYFKGSEGHHIDKECVVYIPVWLHKFIYHNVFTGYNMDLINDLAFEYLELTNGLEQQSL
jgi:hypothetical protein